MSHDVIDIRQAVKPPPEALMAAYKLLTGHMPEWDELDGWCHPNAYHAPDDEIEHVVSGLLMLLDGALPEGPRG